MSLNSLQLLIYETLPNYHFLLNLYSMQSQNISITLIIVYINLTTTYIYHLNQFNTYNQFSKQLGYFRFLKWSMGNRFKSTNNYSLHSKSLEKSLLYKFIIILNDSFSNSFNQFLLLQSYFEYP